MTLRSCSLYSIFSVDPTGGILSKRWSAQLLGNAEVQRAVVLILNPSLLFICLLSRSSPCVMSKFVSHTYPGHTLNHPELLGWCACKSWRAETNFCTYFLPDAISSCNVAGDRIYFQLFFFLLKKKKKAEGTYKEKNRRHGDICSTRVTSPWLVWPSIEGAGLALMADLNIWDWKKKNHASLELSRLCAHILRKV